MTPEERAKELLPCENVCDEGFGHDHSIICPAYYRPAVAAALEAKDKEIAEWKRALKSVSGSLQAEADALRQEIQKLHRLNDERHENFGQAIAAARVEGLRWVRRVADECGYACEVVTTIDGEIAALDRGKGEE